jgi:putative membrane protein
MPASSLATYCGPPPLPQDLWGRWNLDPVLLALMAVVVAAFMLMGSHMRRDRASFLAGMAVLVVIFISPLCALTVALFSARVVHHVLLIAVAAPLLAWALIGRLPPRIQALLPALSTPLLALHVVIFWVWHMPDAYAQALASTPLYWLMQVSLLGSAMLFWVAVLLAAPGRAVVALVVVTAQMGLLGALLVFAHQPLYLPHLSTTAPFGMAAHTDQQLAGLIMWVPAALPYLLVAMLRLTDWLRRSEARRA